MKNMEYVMEGNKDESKTEENSKEEAKKTEEKIKGDSKRKRQDFLDKSFILEKEKFRKIENIIDKETKENYEKFKQEVIVKALYILKVQLPYIILLFNNYVNICSTPGDILNSKGLYNNNNNYNNNLADASAEKYMYTKRYSSIFHVCKKEENENKIDEKHTNIDDKKDSDIVEKSEKVDAVGFNNISNIKSDEGLCVLKEEEIKKEENEESKMKLKCRNAIKEELRRITRRSRELIEVISSLQLFVHLHIPKIEDGNNFGVGIQQEAIASLNRMEDSGVRLFHWVTLYCRERGDIIKKLEKYKEVKSINKVYEKCLQEYDEKQWVSIQMIYVDLRNNYAILYDLFCKNFDRIIMPKGNIHSSSMIYNNHTIANRNLLQFI